MSQRAEQYGDLANTNVENVFAGVYNEISNLQFQLVLKKPESKLLKMVTLGAKDLVFSEDFGNALSKLTGIPRFKLGNWYSALGHYIDLLEKECMA